MRPIGGIVRPCEPHVLRHLGCHNGLLVFDSEIQSVFLERVVEDADHLGEGLLDWGTCDLVGSSARRL